MPLKVSCTITGERESIAEFDAFDVRARNNLRTVISKNAEILLSEIISGAPNGLGELKRSISKRSSNDGLTASIKASRKQWAYAEWGSGPLGARTATSPPKWFKRRGTQKFPNWRNLAKWAESRSLNPFLVAKRIFERQGTAAKPYFTPVVESNKDRILLEIRDAVVGSIPSWTNDPIKVREGVTVTVGGAKFDTEELGWVG